MSLGRLREEMTYQEVYLWCAYFGVVNDEQADQMKKAQRRRR